MLKWAVNGPRQSYLPDANTPNNLCNLQTAAFAQHDLNDNALQASAANAERRKLKRKSSDFYLARRLTHWLEKENQLTSTPLHSTLRCASHSTLRKLGSLKDLSNIVPDNTKCAINKPEKRCVTPEPPAKRNNPKNYAATLPTFDVEYSPGGLVPGPILALRGLGVADAYFEKPRYFAPAAETRNTLATNTNKTLTMEQPTASHSVNEEATSLSSSKMGDLTLERMIDSILESTRKEKKAHKCQQQPVMSPSYTPAEDPANDLHEFWDARRNEMLHQQRQRRRRRTLPVKMRQCYNEREVRSPVGGRARLQQRESCNFHLRRQRAVRRKRRISSAQKNAGKRLAASDEASVTHAASAANDMLQLEADNVKVVDNTSPDSGHNSCSDVEDDSTLEGSDFLHGVLQLNETNVLDQTKRRLNFSNNFLEESQC